MRSSDAARVALDLDASTVDVVRALRRRDRVVALIGSGWSGGDLVGCDPSRVLDMDDDPFAAVDDVVGPGWWLGYWGYPLLHRLESVPDAPPPPNPLPAQSLGWYERVLRHRDDGWWAEGVGSPEELTAWAASVLAEPAARPFEVGPLIPDRTPQQHQDAVGRTLGHIVDGDVFQVNITTAFRGAFTGDPLDLFCTAVETLSPAYAALVVSAAGAVVSLSPELFLRRSGAVVTTSPIKGTAPRSSDPREDADIAAALVASGKDRAENVMIVDLMRNDLARVCVPGTVWASGVRAEPHAVWHLVADVHGRTEPGTSQGDLLRATFPPGSVTGAPKVRAMQLIAELEPTGRRVYTGAVGMVTADHVELNVAIRTFEVRAGTVTLGVGGGIVADSDPLAEWEECLVKARPLVAAVGGTIAAAPNDLRAAAPALASAPDLPARRPATPLTHPARVLFLDNYDSFVHNLVDDARRLGAHATVVRNDVLPVDDLVLEFLDEGFTHLVISPGPGAPADAGVSVELVRRLGPGVPVLGVCLGHQAIIEAYGGTVVHAPSVVHGKASWVHHDGEGIWAELPSPLLLGRYHSLAAGALPDDLVVTARTDDGVVMGVRHRTRPVQGIQGHPESVLTEHGSQLLRNFLA